MNNRKILKYNIKMICTGSCNTNHLINSHNIEFDREEHIHDDNEDEGHSNGEENTNSELFIRLTDMVYLPFILKMYMHIILINL